MTRILPLLDTSLYSRLKISDSDTRNTHWQVTIFFSFFAYTLGVYNMIVEIRQVCSSYQQPHQLRAFQTVLQASTVHPWAVIHTTVHSIPCINKCKNPRSEGWKIKIDQSVTYSEEFSAMFFRAQVSLYLHISRRCLGFPSLLYLIWTKMDDSLTEGASPHVQGHHSSRCCSCPSMARFQYSQRSGSVVVFVPANPVTCMFNFCNCAYVGDKHQSQAEQSSLSQMESVEQAYRITK